MSFELIFTSVPRGLKPGSRGFASVAFTEGMPANYVQLCESLSGYVHVYGPEDPDYSRNPVGFSHLVGTVGGRTFSILSRVGSYGTDYTGRTNKLAHHIMLAESERPPCGPALAMNGGKLFATEWQSAPAYIPVGHVSVPDRQTPRLRAVQWERMTGDAGLAGALAQSFLDAPERPSFLLFEPGMDLLPLISEAQALLPTGKRWDLTFSTYFTTLPVGMKCAWRCCLPDSEALVTARRTPNALVIDLRTKIASGGYQPAGDLVDLARTGVRSVITPKSETSVPSDARSGPVKATSLPVKQAAKRVIAMPGYAEALRPRMPPRSEVASGWSRTAKFSGAAGIVSILILAAVIVVKHYRPSQSAESAPRGTGSVAPVPVEDTQKMGAGAQAANAGHRNDAADPDATFKGSPRDTSPSLSRETGEGESQPAPASFETQRRFVVGNTVEFSKSAEPTFYNPDGHLLKATRKEGVAGERPYFADTNGTKLAVLKNEATLSDFHQSVGLVEIESGSTSTLCIPRPLIVTSAPPRPMEPFILTISPAGVDAILRPYLSAASTRIGGKAVRAGEVFTCNVSIDDETTSLTLRLTLEAAEGRRFYSPIDQAGQSYDRAQSAMRAYDDRTNSLATCIASCNQATEQYSEYDNYKNENQTKLDKGKAAKERFGKCFADVLATVKQFRPPSGTPPVAVTRFDTQNIAEALQAFQSELQKNSDNAGDLLKRAYELLNDKLKPILDQLGRDCGDGAEERRALARAEAALKAVKTSPVVLIVQSDGADLLRTDWP